MAEEGAAGAGGDGEEAGLAMQVDEAEAKAALQPPQRAERDQLGEAGPSLHAGTPEKGREQERQRPSACLVKQERAPAAGGREEDEEVVLVGLTPPRPPAGCPPAKKARGGGADDPIEID